MERLRHVFTSRSLLLIGATFAFGATVHAQSTMFPEELAVRAAYARITYGAEISVVNELAVAHLASPSDSPADTADATAVRDRLQHGQPHFTLASMRVGDMSEIANQSLEDMVTRNTGTILQLQQASGGLTVNGHLYEQNGVRAVWSQQPPHGYSWREIMVKNFNGKSAAPFTRYAAYEVLLTLDSETRAYRALVLFKPDGEIAAIDTMLNWRLDDYFKISMYPHVFLEIPMVRSQSLVAAWLASHRVAAASCKIDQQHDCFDPVAGIMGIHPNDLEHSLINPPAPNSPNHHQLAGLYMSR